MRQVKVVQRVKRQMVRRTQLPKRAAWGRRWLIQPQPGRPFSVELFIAPTRKHMHRIIAMRTGTEEHDARCMGLVRHYFSRATGRFVVRPGQIIAQMFLNAADLRMQPGEIIAHECTHAGMAWARIQKANLSRMPGEEVLCYAVGRMVPQVNRIGYAMGIFK